MNKYEAMLIVRTDFLDKAGESLFKQLNDVFSKNGATIISSGVWAEKKKLSFPIKKQREGTYYLVVFESPPEAIEKIRHTLALNDTVIRTSILKC